MPNSGLTRIDWVNQMCAAEDVEASRSMFEGHSEWHNPETLRTIHAELIRCLYADQPRARRLGEIAGWAAKAAGDNLSRATGLRCEGHVHYAEARYESSVESYRRALSLLEADDAEAGRIYFGGLQPLIYLGRYDEAHEWAERARLIFERHNDTARLARLDLNVGNIYFRQDRYPEALERYQRALSVLRTSSEPQDYAAVLSNIAVCHISLGDFRKAFENYHEVRDWCERHGLHRLVLDADYNIAYLHYLRGEYQKALELYHRVRKQYADAGIAYHCALCDLDNSEILLELNMAAEAATLAAQAAAAFEHLGMNYERAKATVNHAVAVFRRGDSPRAARLFEEAGRLFAREDNVYWRAILDLYQAIVCEHDGMLEEARDYGGKALHVLAGSPLAGKEALCHSVLARLAIRQGNFAEARGHLAAVEKNLYSPSLRCHHHYLLGALHEKTGNLPEAAREYRQAVDELEEVRRAMWVEELKISFLHDKAEIYEALTRLSLQPGVETAGLRAFDWVQRAKSRSLLERLHAHPDGDDSREGPYADQIAELRHNLTASYRQLETVSAGSRSPAGETLKAVRSRLLEGERELQSLWLQTRQKTAPRNPDFLPAEEIQSILPADTALVEFYPIAGVWHTWLLTRDKVQHVVGTRVAQIWHPLRLLQFQLGKFTLGPEYTGRFQAALLAAVNAHLRELYDLLIAPLVPHLNASRLVIAPNGVLHNLPFHALANAAGRALIDDYAISYVPSASVFARCTAKPPGVTRGSLIMAVPDSAAPRIKHEAEALAAVLPGARVLAGERASAQNLESAGLQCKYIHIAAHGLLRRDNPLFSAVNLGDSRLQLFDLNHMRLDADLVTLSGCSTGVSAVTGADELLGLMRGILGAGARSLLASLWDVNDESTTLFMISFYRHFFAAALPDKTSAVRKAMLEVRNCYGHPYYWAPFALVGAS